MAYCNECEKDINKDELDYSEKNYMRPLCRMCQHDDNVYKGTPQQEILCMALRSAGYKAYMELFDGHKHIDIAIPKVKINIEVDGLQHIFSRRQRLADRKRAGYSFSKGYETYRILNTAIDNDFDRTVSKILVILAKQGKQFGR